MNLSLIINPVGMTTAVLEQTVQKFLALPLPQHAFVFQGRTKVSLRQQYAAIFQGKGSESSPDHEGDPLSVGQDFFLAFLGFVKRFSTPETRPTYTVQTDGTLITDGWAQLFAAHTFLISVNLGDPTTKGWGAGIVRLRNFQVPFTIRVQVSRANVDNPEAVYSFLRDKASCNSHHYIPCMDSDSGITGEQWGNFLCRVYDTWFPADTQKVSVRFFDTILAQMVQGAEAMCECSSDCRAAFVVEPTGDVFPCAFYVTPEWKLGNIVEEDFLALLQSPVYEAFGMRKRKWPAKCNSCDALRYCRGDCVKHRGEGGDSSLCDGLKAFYAHAMPTLSRLGWQLYQKVNNLKPGRNDPCPCGSGKKLKKCCGKAP